MSDEKKTKPVLVSFGLGGHGIDYVYTDPKISYRNCRISGYDRPERFERELITRSGKSYTAEWLEGCPVIDKRKVLENDASLALSMPMHSPDLAHDEVQKFDADAGMPFTAMIGAANAGNVWGLLCAKALTDKKFSGLDSVGTSVYLRLWHTVGARIGKMVNGRILWADERLDQVIDDATVATDEQLRAVDYYVFSDAYLTGRMTYDCAKALYQRKLDLALANAPVEPKDALSRSDEYYRSKSQINLTQEAIHRLEGYRRMLDLRAKEVAE